MVAKQRVYRHFGWENSKNVTFMGAKLRICRRFGSKLSDNIPGYVAISGVKPRVYHLFGWKISKNVYLPGGLLGGKIVLVAK